MNPALTDNLALMFGLIGMVVVVSALLSGFIEKSSFPQVAVFLGLGAAVGPYGLGLLNVGLDAPILRVVATLSLALVLFTDALTIDIAEVKKHAKLATLILGPGTLIAAGLIALAAVYVLNLPWPLALMLAAPLASTDPVMLRGLLKRPDLPSSTRQSLRLESALNDVVLLPIVLIAMAFVVPTAGESVNAGKLLIQMLVIGPGAGALVAWVGIALLDQISKKVGVRRDYESLYSLGIALAAFAAAEALHGSGFLAVFAAGLMISSIDVELCDCFREYGETTAEILLLFTFVLLGASLIWTGMGMVTLAVLAFAALALMARPLGLTLALARAKTDAHAKRLIIWYGPRGLSTLLLILVPVFANTPGSEPLFHIATVVVLISVALHGGSIMFFGNRFSRRARKNHQVTLAVTPVAHEAPPQDVRITTEQIEDLEAQGHQIHLIDVRRQEPYERSAEQIKNTQRIHPMFARRDVERLGIPKDAYIALFCGCPEDATSVRVAEELRSAGWLYASAVKNGWDALVAAGYQVETKPVEAP